MIPQPAWTRFAPERLVLGMATLGPLGYLPAPGTWGTAAGLAWYTILLGSTHWFPALLLVGGMLYLAFALCGEAEFRMHRIDPPEVILDEFACAPIALVGLHDVIATHHAWVVFVLAFALFRFFDILKPLGIARLQRFQGGFGVVADDFVAALVSGIIIQVVVRLTPLLHWIDGWFASGSRLEI